MIGIKSQYLDIKIHPLKNLPGGQPEILPDKKKAPDRHLLKQIKGVRLENRSA